MTGSEPSILRIEKVPSAHLNALVRPKAASARRIPTLVHVAQLLHELPALLSDLDSSAASVLQIAHAAQLPRASARANAAAPQRIIASGSAASDREEAPEDKAVDAAAADVP